MCRRPATDRPGPRPGLVLALLLVLALPTTVIASGPPGGGQDPGITTPTLTDAPDTCAAAIPIATGATWTPGAIEAAGDQDWYTFTLGAQRRVLITLGDLRIDSRLELYDTCAHRRATSARTGLVYEELLRVLPAGTYRIRVSAEAGAWTPRGHVLRVRIIPDKVMVLSSTAWVPYPGTFPARPRIAGEVINGTTTTRESIKIRIRYYDAADTLLSSSFTWARRERLGPGKRSMFVSYGIDVPGYDRVRVTVARSTSSLTPPVKGLTATLLGTDPDGYGGLTYLGELHNTTARPVHIARAMLTVYDDRGQVRNADFTDPPPDPLPAGATTDWGVYLGDRTTGSRVVVTTHGYPR